MKRTLIVIFVIAAVLLGSTLALNGVARSRAQAEHIRLMETLLPDGKDFIRLGDSGDDELIRSVHKCDAGFVIETVTYGYADDITVVVGVDNEGVVTGLVTLDAHETLGLGSRILTDTEFLAGFLNKSGSFKIATSGVDAFSSATGEVSSDAAEIEVDGISGATVSSKAVARCVTAAVAYVTGADIESSATSWGG